MTAKYQYGYVPWNLHPKTKSKLNKMRVRIGNLVGMKMTQDEIIVEILKHEERLIEAIKDQLSQLGSEPVLPNTISGDVHDE